MPKYITRTLESWKYQLKRADGSDICHVADHRLNTKELFSLYAKYPDAFINPSPVSERATYRMELDTFLELAEKVDNSDEENEPESEKTAE